MQSIGLFLQSFFLLVIAESFTKSTVIVSIIFVFAMIKKYGFHIHRQSLPWVALFISICFISAFWSPSPSAFLSVGQAAGVLLVWLAMAGGLLFRPEQEAGRLARLNVVGWLATLLLAIAVSCVGLISHSDIGQVLLRRFASKNGAVILVMTSFPVLWTILRLQYGKSLFATVVALLLLIVFISGSSSAMTGLLVGLFVWFLAERRPRQTGAVLSVLLPALFLAMPLLVWPVSPEAVAAAVPHFPLSFFHRLVIWKFSAQQIVQAPFFGWGFDAARAIPGGEDLFRALFPVPWSEHPYHVIGQYLPLHTHNAALQVWLELGAMGALVVAAALWKIPRATISHGRRDIAGVSAGALVAAVIVSCVAFGAFQSWWLAVLVLVWSAINSLPKTPRHDAV